MSNSRKEECFNYCTISIISVLTKLYEHVFEYEIKIPYEEVALQQRSNHSSHQLFFASSLIVLSYAYKTKL